MSTARPVRLLLGVLVALPLAVACGSSEADGSAATGTSASPASSGPFTEVTAGTLSDETVPVPAEGDVTLVVLGAGRANAAGELRLSLADLERLPMVEAVVFEPFIKRDVVFQGVRLEDLLAFADLPDSAAIHAVALNDYAVDLPVEVLRREGTLLATRADGRPITLEDGGPTRIVFTDDHPDTGNESLWIWSLASLERR